MPTASACPGHVILLIRHGIHIIENLYLEELARDRVYAFTFICVPPKLRGATGSPVRPLAVVQQYKGEAAERRLESTP
jgi:kynurenine formamidase